MAAYPVSAIDSDSDSVIVAGINLDWLSKIMSNLSGRPGITAVLIDSAGIVMAAPADEASLIGRALDTVPLLSAIAEQAIDSKAAQGSLSFTAADGSRRALRFARIAGTQSRLIVSIDETKVTAAINREIRTAYLQLCFVCLFVLLGALIAAEKLIIHPIEIMAAMTKRFGQGDGSARVARSRLPAEFIPLARAFNAMAAQLDRTRARAGRHQRPADRDGVDRHAVGSCQPARIPEPARLRMDEGPAIQFRDFAVDDRCRSLQALQ